MSETWINEATAYLFSINVYVCEHKFRSCKRGGGISIFFRDQVAYILKNDFIVFQTDFESIFIEVEGKYMNSDVNVIIGVIYRPPDNDIKVFTQKFCNVLNYIHEE